MSFKWKEWLRNWVAPEYSVPPALAQGFMVWNARRRAYHCGTGVCSGIRQACRARSPQKLVGLPVCIWPLVGSVVFRRSTQGCAVLQVPKLESQWIVRMERVLCSGDQIFALLLPRCLIADLPQVSRMPFGAFLFRFSRSVGGKSWAPLCLKPYWTALPQ